MEEVVGTKQRISLQMGDGAKDQPRRKNRRPSFDRNLDRRALSQTLYWLILRQGCIWWRRRILASGIGVWRHSSLHFLKAAATLRTNGTLLNSNFADLRPIMGSRPHKANRCRVAVMLHVALNIDVRTSQTPCIDAAACGQPCFAPSM